MFKDHTFAALILLTLSTQVAMAVRIPAAIADEPTPAQVKALDTLNTLVTNMGYSTTYATDKSHIYFDVQGKYNYHIDMSTSPNNELVYIYYDIDTFDAGQLAKIPYQKLMEFQNSGNVFFSMDGSSGKDEDLFANEVFGFAGLTPVVLRGELDDFINSLDGTDNLWNKKLWK